VSMDGEEERSRAYVVPSYRAPDDTAWYHFLHGNVPGHQIDFIYRAEVPQGPLTRQHFSHLARLMKYIEPQSNERFAFAIGNLSRDDTQYEPGHGGLALIFGLRIRGTVDHAGRQDPPFAHAVAAIDRSLDYTTVIESAVAFHRHVLGAAESAEWYRAYVERAESDPAGVPAVLEGYVGRFADLPQPAPSALEAAWLTRGAPQPKRIVLVHDDDVSFGEVAVAAARIASVLYCSDIRWTVISNGREDDVPNGVSIRLLSRSEIGPGDAAAMHELSELPNDAAAIASMLFGATPAVTAPARARGWRERFSEMDHASVDEAPGHGVEAPKRRSWEGAPPPRAREKEAEGDAAPVDVDVDVDDVDDSTATVKAPTRPHTPSQRAPAMPASEPPAGDRAAVMEVPIPPAPALPAEVAPVDAGAARAAQPGVTTQPVAVEPAQPVAVEARHAAPAAIAPPRVTPAVEPVMDRGASKRTFWMIVGGFCVVAIVLVALLASQGGPPSNGGPGPTGTAPAPPPPATTPAPVTTIAPEPPAKVTSAPVPVPVPVPTATVTATASASASAAPERPIPIKRPPKADPFGKPLR